MEKIIKDATDTFLIGVCEESELSRFHVYSLIMEMMEEDGYLMPEDIDDRVVH